MVKHIILTFTGIKTKKSRARKHPPYIIHFVPDSFKNYKQITSE